MCGLLSETEISGSERMFMRFVLGRISRKRPRKRDTVIFVYLSDSERQITPDLQHGRFLYRTLKKLKPSF